MAHHKSAKKRARQMHGRRARNRHVRSSVRTAIKSARTGVADGQPDECARAVRNAERMIRKAASKGVISKKQASRQVSRLAKRARALQA